MTKEQQNKIAQNNQSNAKQKNNQNKKNKKSKWIFLGSVLILYLILSLISPQKTLRASKYSSNLLLTILPILLLVLGFMFLFNLIDEKKLKNVIERSPQHIKYFEDFFL